MPKVNDIKAYWNELATKAGLQGDDLQKVTSVIENEKFAKAFSEGFKPLPDYSHDLDDVRNRTKAEKDQEYREWYDKEQQKYNEFVNGLNELDWYRKTYPREKKEGSGNDTGLGMTKEEMEKLLDARMQTTLNDVLSRRDSAVLDLLEVREFHMGKFKKPLDVKTFETAWKEHPEWGGSLKQAYKSFVEPDVKKAEEADWNAKIEARYQEGIRDGFTRKAVPTDHQSKMFSPMFDKNEDISKMTDNDQERHSREAFFEGLRQDTTKSA
jgi:hypothetical protein